MKTVTEYIRPLYVIVGLLITLSTAIIPVSHLAGSTDYGLPFPWLVKLILSPENFPWRVNWIYLIIDIAIWTTVCFAVQDLAPKFKHHEAILGSG